MSSFRRISSMRARHPRPGRGLAMALVFLVATPASAASLTPPGDAPDVAPIAFHVFRDGRPMGHHSVSFRREGEDLHVQVDILLEVQIAFITLFRYRHRNNEVWRDGRLVSIDTETDDDGKDFWLRGRATDAGFQVEGSSGSFLAPAEIMPTSYWNPDTVNRRSLLDTQKGRLIEVSVAPAGRDGVRLPGGEVEAKRYALTGDLNLDLWYSDAGEWVKTAFSLRGSTFAYARKEASATLAGDEETVVER